MSPSFETAWRWLQRRQSPLERLVTSVAKHERDALDRRVALQELGDRPEGDVGRGVGREAERARADRGRTDRPGAEALGLRQDALIGATKQVQLVLPAGGPDRT